MNRLPNIRLMKWGVLIFIIHATLLFVVIPGVSSRMAHLYTQDRPSDGYYELAENLIAGNGYRFYPDTARTLMREPGYPLLLAGLLVTLGHSFAVVKLANMS